jgi:protein-tyrosine phosphatase
MAEETSSMAERVLDWEGCNNVRDLGGLRTNEGGTTRFGAVLRGDTPARLTKAGWAALYDYGVRTIITLRTIGMEEPKLNFTSPYPDIVTIQAPIEDVTDKEYVEKFVMTNLWGTPLFFRDALQRWSDKFAAVITAMARAKPGGVYFHCIRGHDRTGITAFLVLALAGVTPEDITADYELSVEPVRDEILAKMNSSVREAILSQLDGLEVESYLYKSGVSREDIAAARMRLTE